MKYSIPLDFYLVMDGTEFNQSAQYGMLPSKNILCSAYSIMKRSFGSLKKYRGFYDNLIIDSGGISAWKKKDKTWIQKETQAQYVEETRSLKPTKICHLDLPMEPSFLQTNGFTKDDAIKTTIKNAEYFLDIDTGNSEKMFGLQGWNLEDYISCIKAFNEIGIFKDKYTIGIGTTCMRTPPSLYQVYQTVVPLIREINPTQRIHAFGIAHPEWLYELYRLGITSGDSATPIIKMVKREIYDSKIIKMKMNPLPKDGSRSLYILNAWLWYMKLWKKFNNNIKQTRL
jgi:queuine/archaeosine tRNA-ribosyltransferase